MSPLSAPVSDIRRGYPALWSLGLIVMAASVTAFAESYNGLRKWAEQHRVTGVWADIWPLQVDAFIAAGELTLLLSALYLWPMRVRILAWTVSLTGLSVSVLCNAGHVGHRASVADHMTAALPPVAAIAGLVISLSVIKQVTLMNPSSARRRRADEKERRAQEAQDAAQAAEAASAEAAATAEQPSLDQPQPVDQAVGRTAGQVADIPQAEAPPTRDAWWARQEAQREPVPAGAGAEQVPTADSLRNRYDRLFGAS